MRNCTAKLLLAGMVAATGLLGGCGGGQKEAAGDIPDPVKAPDPVTLKFYTRTVLDDYEKYINQYVKKKFPHVTLQVVENKKGSTIEELIAMNDIPDIIWEGVTNLQSILPLEIVQDLRPLAQKHGLDFGVYDSKLVDSIKSYSKNGEVYYLPYNVLAFALHYNKDIFDKFGVPYPTNNMTWDEVIALGNKLTRTDGTIQYVGLKSPINLNRLQMQASLPYVDPKTEQALVTSEGWKGLFETAKRMFPNPLPAPIKSLGDSRNEFTTAKTLAMLPDILLLHNTDMAKLEREGFKWDFVTYPTFKEKPNVGQGLFSDGFILTKSSKHQDVAFQVISYLSTDPEVQLGATKDGRITGLKNEEIRKQAFANNELAKGRNTAALLGQSYPVPAPSSVYDRDAASLVNGKLLAFINGTLDVNTALREAQDLVTKKIAEKKSQ